MDYVHFLAGLPAPDIEEEPNVMPVPTPVYLPNPQTLDMSQMGGGFGGGNSGGPYLPPPVASPPPPTGFSGGMGGMMAPEGGAFG